MNVMKRLSGFFKPPENLSVFNIPVLIKKEERTYLSYTAHKYEVYHEGYTDGFYYVKDRIKYFRVKEKDNEPVYFKQDDLVFLTKEETDAS
jgi:hypothetical protein